MSNVEKLQKIIDNISDITFKGVYLWKYLEYEITSGIISDCENQDKNMSINGISDFIPEATKEMLEKNEIMLASLQQKDILIGMLPLRRPYKGKLVHTAMDAYLQGIDTKNYIVLEPMSDGQNDDIVFTSNRVRYFGLGVVSKYGQDSFDEREIIDFLVEKYIYPIEKEFDIKFSKSILLRCVFKANYVMKERRAYIEFFSEVLDRVRPKVICYTHGPDPLMIFLNEVAQLKGVPTLEIAHGDTAFNLKYPEWLRCSNYYLTHSDMITERMKQRGIQNVITVGKPGIYDNVSYNVRENTPIVISFISSLEKDLLMKAINLAKRLDKSKYIVVFKLHQSELWSDEEINKIKEENSNWEFVDGFVDVRDLYAISDIVVGVRSSALLDALPFNRLKILALKDKYEENLLVGNYSFFYELSEKGDISMVYDDEDIYREVMKYERGREYRGKINHFWPQNGNQRFREYLQNFLVQK